MMVTVFLMIWIMTTIMTAFQIHRMIAHTTTIMMVLTTMKITTMMVTALTTMKK